MLCDLSPGSLRSPGAMGGALSGRFDNDPVSDEQIGKLPARGLHYELFLQKTPNLT
jgi:hypothetical protein